MMTRQDADEQIKAATGAIRATLLRLLQEGEVHPQVIILAMATALGEFAAGAALATREDVGPMTDDLAALVREVVGEHHELLRMIELPTVGNA
jgi:hypothetical protein